MTEQKIEKIAIDEFSSTLSSAGLSNIQAIGAWQATSDTALKAFEDGNADGILGIKVSPRQYETPTIPDGSFVVTMSLTVRADIDTTGEIWLSATEAISDKLQAWQKSYNQYKLAFEIENEFMPTGFNIAGGDCGLDKQNDVWQFTQSFNLFGVIS